MIEFGIRNNGRDLAEFVGKVQQQVREGVLAGMSKAMPALADHVVSTKLSGQVIASRTGALAEAVRNSKKIWEGNDAVQGYVKMPGKIGIKKLPIGYWLSRGTHVPAVDMRQGTFATMVRESKRKGRASLMVPGFRQIGGGSGTQSGKDAAHRVMAFEAGGPFGGTTTVFTRKHRAFEVPARPVMEESLREFQGRIVEYIQQGIMETIQ